MKVFNFFVFVLAYVLLVIFLINKIMDTNPDSDQSSSDFYRLQSYQDRTVSRRAALSIWDNDTYDSSYEGYSNLQWNEQSRSQEYQSDFEMSESIAW